MPILQAIQTFAGPAYMTRMSDVEASMFTPPCECVDCQHGFYAKEEQFRPQFWYRNGLSDYEAQSIAAKYVGNAQQDRQYLLQLLSSHADTIINRWTKKSRERRQALLVETSLELYEHRWLIPRYCYMPESKTQAIKGQSRTRRNQLFLPWLSLEVLKMNPVILFALLHNRTAYPLQDWATFDGRQLILGWAAGHFDVDFSAKCVIMYGPKYGKLVDWEAAPAHRADVIGFPKARLILEAQAYLMGLLRTVVDKILEGVDLSKPATSEKWKKMIMVGFRHTSELELWSPYTNQAFSAPPVFSIDNLISTVQTRLDATGDHLWDLQTNPAYMRRYIRTLHQGEFHKTIGKDAAGDMLTTEIFHDVLTYWRWTWIKCECEYVKGVHDRFRDSIRPGRPLPPVYDKALGALELLLVNEVIKRTIFLANTLPQRPGFSHNWTFKWRPAEGPTVFQVIRNPQAPVEQKEHFEKDPLEWCLMQLQGKPDTQTNYDHALLFAFLENHLATSGPKEKGRIDEVLAQKLSDLSASHEMLVSVRLHRPQNEARDIEEVQRSEDRIAWKGQGIPRYLSDDDTIKLGTSLLKDFYEAPLPSGQKNSTWLTRTQNIRQALEAFWRGLRKSPKRVFELSNFSKEEIRFFLDVISVSLTQEYADLVQDEKDRVLASIESARMPVGVSVQTEWGTSTTTQPKISSRKAKNKTRPSEQISTMEDINHAVADMTVVSKQGQTPKIPVTKRAYDMLSFMFSTTAEESSKTVDWDMFVHAMADMGFTARNGGGSVVVFEKDGNRDGKIIFHKPHPVPKIDPIMLHSMGRRMGKWFGWHRDLFFLE